MADMTTKILTVDLNADAAINGIINLNDAIGKNTQQIKANNDMIAENSKAMKQEGADVMALTAQNQKLAESNVELEAKTKVLKDERRALQKEIQNEVRANVQAEGSLKALRAELSNLTKQYDSLSKSERQNEQVGGALLKQINDVTTEIKQAEEETQRYFRNVGNYPEVTESVKGALRVMRDEIMSLTLEYRQMSDEMKNSEAGQAMKQRIEELTQKASEYKDAMNDVKQSIAAGASDTRGLDAAVQAGQTLAATFGLANNAAIALGISTDGLQQAMLKMQQAMQAVQALQVIQNSLQNQSALMRTVAIVQSKAAAAAEAIEAKVKTQATGATIAQTAAQRVFNAVAKANPYVLLATAILTVIGLIVGYTAATKDATEATDESNDATKRAADAQSSYEEAMRIATDEAYRRQQVEREMADDIADSVSKQLANYTYLQKKWAECGNDVTKQKEFLIRYKDELNNTGFVVKNVGDAYTLFVKKGKSVIEMYYLLAEAAAAAAVAQEAFERQIKRKESGSVANGGFYYTVSAGTSVSSLSEEEKKLVNGPSHGTLSEEGANKVNRYRSEQAKKLRKSLDDADQNIIDYAMNRRSNIEKRLSAVEKDVGLARSGGSNSSSGGGSSGGGSRGGGSSNSRSSGGSGKSSKNTPKDDALTLDQLADRLLDVQADAYQRMAKAGEQYTQQWIEDSKKAIEAKANDEIDAAEEARMKDIANLKKSLNAKKITQGQYNVLALETQKAYDEKLGAIDAQRLADLKKIDDEVAQNHKEAADKANKDAADALKKAKEDAAKQVQIMLESMPEGTRGQMEWRLRQLSMQMQEELAMWENNEQMKVAIQKKYEQESEKVMQDYESRQMEMQKQKYEAFATIVNGMSQLFGEFADESKEAAALQKTLATAEVMLAQAVAIANAIKAAAMGSINPWQMIAQIATSVTAVTVAMVQAFKSLNSAKFATGGYIRGAGTSTSDSIPVRVSNGESIMNANTTAMFSGLLSSLNQLGGGVPIQVTQTAANIRGEDMLARAFARGVAMLPNPVVSVEDINRGQRQVEVMNERATL